VIASIDRAAAAQARTRVLLVGHGRMGRLVESLAGEYGCEVAGVVEIDTAPRLSAGLAPEWGPIDVAIDFSFPEAVPVNVPALARLGVNVVIGTTGWKAHEAALRDVAATSGVGIVAAPNFSAGVVMFEAIVGHAAALMASQPEFSAWLHEAHHAMKKDAPSGTALQLKAALERAGYQRRVDVSSTRAGYIPGVHTVGFDGPAESITLTHSARDRSAFARGALRAAQWVKGRRGWFTMQDVLGVKL
jgi:4-hydroxy-tetrahydrodipicolinate reductase